VDDAADVDGGYGGIPSGACGRYGRGVCRGGTVVVDSYKTAKVTYNNEQYLIVCKDYVLAFAE
jgi:co-chaperonin GroES (HSP10)